MSIPPEKIQEVRERADIGRIIGQTVTLKKQGRRLMGLCPFHQEKSPSFSVDPDMKLYHCFGCHAGGDLFDFVMKKEGVDFPEAVRRVAADAGVSLPEREESPEERSVRKRRERLLRVNELTAAFYQALLADSPRAQAYLEEERGLTKETIARFRLGFSGSEPSALARHLEGRGAPLELARSLGLVTSRGDQHFDRFRGRIVCPISGPHGEIVAFGARRADWLEQREGSPKYLNSPESELFDKSSTIYGLDTGKLAMRRSGRAVVVEGYFDVILLRQAGIEEAVAGLGTAFTAKHAAELMRHAKVVVLLYDGDAAGRSAALRATPVLLAHGADVRLERLPEGHDPDTFVRAEGADALLRRLADAHSAIEVLVDEEAKAHPGLTGLPKVVELARPMLTAIKDPLLRDVTIDALARRLALEPATFRRHLGGRPPPPPSAPPPPRAAPAGPSTLSVRDLELLRQLAEDARATLTDVEAFAAWEALRNPVLRAVAVQVQLAVQGGTAVDGAFVIRAAETAGAGEGDRRKIRETLLSPLPERFDRKECLKQMLREYIDAELRILGSRFRGGREVEDSETLARIQEMTRRRQALS